MSVGRDGVKSPLNPEQLRKRALIFYFAAGVNLLMALWVLSVGSSQTGGSTLTVVMLVFLGFAGLNYYMARRITKYLRRMAVPAQRAPTDPQGKADE